MKDCSVSGRGFKACVRNLQNILQLTARTGTKRIKRRYDIGRNEWLESLQTDQDRVKFELYTEKRDVLIWLVDGKVEYLHLTDYTGPELINLYGEDAVEAVKPSIQLMESILKANTPEGLVIEDLKEIRDWLQGTSKGSSGRCTRGVDGLKHGFRLSATPGGEIMIQTTHGPKDFYAYLHRQGLSLSFSDALDHVSKWTLQERNKELNAARKFMRKQFPQAFSGKIIRA